MKNFCRSCEDQDRTNDDCALRPLGEVALLKFKAAVQRANESDPMFPHELVHVHEQYMTGNTPRQQNWQYLGEVEACITAHQPPLPENVIDIHKPL